MGQCDSCDIDAPIESVRRVLWIALILNLLMFIIETVAGFFSNSLSIQSDALDFLGDAANYGISLWVLKSHIKTRAKASMLKAATMGGFGVYILINAGLRFSNGTPPDAPVMGIVAIMALAVNVGVAIMLYKHRSGDSNMQSVWLCSRNDALGNIAVLLAAFAVHTTNSVLPDLIVACLIAILVILSSVRIIKIARNELSI